MKLSDHLDATGEKRVAFARRLNITPSHVTRLCRGEVMPSLPLAVRIAAATDGKVTAADFMPPAPDAAA